MATIGNSLEALSEELYSLYISGSVPVQTINKPETPAAISSFYRKYVSKNIPVKLTGCTDNWDALKKWEDDYLLDKIGDCTVTVAVTPNGLADAIHKGQFTLPFETSMLFKEFLAELRNPRKDRVLYLQNQNDSFNSEFSNLLLDIESDPEWAREVFQMSPDAVNFWMGDTRAISSMHKDPYENVYSVIRGKKRFTLFPPTDRPLIPYRTFPVSRYTEEGTLKSEGTEKVQWIDLDQENPVRDAPPQCHPVVVEVGEGETLYLPSMWFHHVQQTHGTIAVNHWYDIDYGPSYGLFEVLDTLTRDHVELPIDDGL